MYCSNRSSMATLLQQKNCMKTLSNGTTVSGTQQQQQQQSGSKILLPHEMVGLPVQPISQISSTTSSNTATSAITSIEHSSINNTNQQQQQSQYFHYNSNNYNNINDGNMFRMSSTTISSTVSYNNITSSEQNTLMTDDNLIKTEDNIDNIIKNECIVEPNVQNIEDEETEPPPEIDIVINNVVCSFSVKCHLNLREIALNGFNVEFRRENGMVTMKLRRPYTTASIWSSGRITCTGATSEDQAKIAARRYARCLQKLGFMAKFNNFRVVNVLGTCSMPWCIRIVNFSEKYKKDASYEPELHPGVTYKIKTPKATLKIFSTGSITVTAASVADVQTAIEHIFPLVYEFRKKRPAPIEKKININQQNNVSKKRKRPYSKIDNNEPTEDIMYVSDQEEHLDGSDDDV